VSQTEHHQIPQVIASTAVEAHNEPAICGCESGGHQQHETQVSPPAPGSSAGTSDSSEEQKANSEERSAAVKLCRHVKGDGVYCQIPALAGRPYCYRHLRLRGQQMRMARAIAQHQPYQFVLPSLDDMHAVQAALTHVAVAMTAGLLERRSAGLLLYALQQAAGNLRFLAQMQTQVQIAVAAEADAPPLSPSLGDRGGPSQPQRVVEEYPEFEAEFGLPPGLDLTLLPQVAFPPPEKAGNAWVAQATPQPGSINRWTKEDIEMEEVENRRSNLSEERYNQECRKVHAKIERKVALEIRHKHEAEWEAEAARRNAKEDEKAQRWRSMDLAQQRAFMEGVMTGREEEAAERRQAEARNKKPAAKAGGEEATVKAGELPEVEVG
jgi:hypothetical protein